MYRLQGLVKSYKKCSSFQKLRDAENTGLSLQDHMLKPLVKRQTIFIVGTILVFDNSVKYKVGEEFGCLHTSSYWPV